jgi:predicted Zn-dependent protease
MSVPSSSTEASTPKRWVVEHVRLLFDGFFALVLSVALLLPVTPVSAALLGEFSIKDEVELGRKFNLMIRSRFPLVEDPEVTDYIRDMVDRLRLAMPPQPFPIQVFVVRNPAMNAFAAPGGHLFVFTGMILGVESESELAGVMAHELAHVSQRHIARHIERAQLISIGSMLGLLAGGLLGSTEAGQAVMFGSLAGGQSAYLKYSREDEREADQVGMNYLVAAGYSPKGMPESFEKIRRRKWLSGGNIPTYISTHPDVEERIDYLYQRVARYPDQIQSRQGDDQKLGRIQTMLRSWYTQPEEAIRHFSSDDNCEKTLGRAIALSRLNRMGEAETAFADALRCGREDPLYLREAGRFHFSLGRVDQAGPLLQEAVLRNPSDVIALFYFSRLLSQTGERQQAVGYMERVLRHLPEDPEVHYFLGRALGESGSHFRAHIHLSYAALYRNDRKQTLFHLSKARQLAGDNEEREALKRLEGEYQERSEFWNEK